MRAAFWSAAFVLSGCAMIDSEAQVSPRASDIKRLNDEEIAAVLGIFHRAEIVQARLAQEEAMTVNVRVYADQLLAEHSIGEQLHATLLAHLGMRERRSQVSEELEVTVRRQMWLLTQRQGEEFDPTYMNGQVLTHDWLLSMIDGRLLPDAKSDALRMHIERIRARVVAALEEAQRSVEGGGEEEAPLAEVPGGPAS